jgi:hypothetical protein
LRGSVRSEPWFINVEFSTNQVYHTSRKIGTHPSITRSPVRPVPRMTTTSLPLSTALPHLATALTHPCFTPFFCDRTAREPPLPAPLPPTAGVLHYAADESSVVAIGPPYPVLLQETQRTVVFPATHRRPHPPPCMPWARDVEVPRARAAMLQPWDARCRAWAHTYGWQSRLDLLALARRAAALQRPHHTTPRLHRMRTPARTHLAIVLSLPAHTRAPLNPHKAMPLPLSEQGHTAPPCLPRHCSAIRSHHPSATATSRSHHGQALSGISSNMP